MLPTELFWRCLLEVVFIFLNLQYVSHWLTHTLLPRTLCSLAHFADSYFAPQNILLLNTFWSLEHFAFWNTLLPSTFCFLEHSAPWNTLLPGTFCSCVKCSPQHTLLSGTQKAKCSRKQSVPWSKVCWGKKYSWEQSMLRSKMCWVVKCVEKESELGCKKYHAFLKQCSQGAKCGSACSTLHLQNWHCYLKREIREPSQITFALRGG